MDILLAVEYINILELNKTNKGYIMNEFIAVILIAFFKMITLVAITFGVVILADNEKSGWGWLIFLGIAVATTSYKYTKD